MEALVYLAAILVVGDTVAQPLLPATVDRPRRLATAILAGVAVVTWLSYVVAYLLRDRPQPLATADLVVLVVAAGALFARLVWPVARGGWRGRWSRPRLAMPARSELVDWVLIAAFSAFVFWMMSQTYSFVNGELRISGIVWSDFGPTTAISQSFALGDNFPTEYPHFADFPILYHFLFFFEVGNLTRLGFDPALALNLLSTATLVAMLVVVIALGRVLFRSSAVGRIGATLFFVHGSLSWIPYVAGFASPSQALADIWAKTGPLVSGFPYRGEEWGIWTQGTFLNQRHLAGAIGVLLLGVLFVVERYLAWRAEREAAKVAAERTAEAEAAAGTHQRPAWATGAASARGTAVVSPTAAAPPSPGRGDARRTGRRSALDSLDDLALEFQDRTSHPVRHVINGLLDRRLLGYVVVGFLLGMLPMWNSPVFLAAGAVFAVLFVLLPNRAQMVAVAVAAGSIALPQLLALRPPGLPNAGAYPTLHVGYTVEPASVTNMLDYLGFTFGPKLLLAVPALILGTGLQRRVFLAFTVLVGIAFGLQFSPEVFANHKFLNVWLVALDLFAAAGMVWLWRVAASRRPSRRVVGFGLTASRAIARAAVVVLAVVITTGGIIDLMEIKNSGPIGIRLQGDHLFDWLVAETRPDDVFLTDLYVTHPILLAGRKIYYGWPYYAWSAGYPVGPREERYREMLGGTNPGQVVRLLQQERIAYVAVDDGMRSRNFVPFLNEPLLAGALQQVFSDPENRYGHLVLYRVPGEPPTDTGEVVPGPTPAPVSMQTGGRGSGPGQFVDPRGVAVGQSGEILVADSGNNRIQRFAADGSFLAVYGGKGDQPGRFSEPNGIGVDSKGRIYVADTANHRLEIFDPPFTFVRAWTGPEPGFYGPRDVAVGPDDSVYVLDQGHARVVRLPVNGQATPFGSFGTGAGQLNDPTGLAVAGDQVYVADPSNARVQVFGVDGRFIRSIPVNAWTKAAATADVAISTDGTLLFASSPLTNGVLVIALRGGTGGTLAPSGADVLARPSALAVGGDGRIVVVSFDGPRVSFVPAPGP